MLRPKTKILMNIARPESAFKASMIPNDGVGLLRMEFIISNHIGIHPQTCVHKFFDLVEGHHRFCP